MRNGLPEFHGTKLAHDTGVCAIYKDIHKIEILDRHRMVFDVPGTIGSGGNSGFQAINIAVQFGVSKILLIGFDMHTGNGLHWYGRNDWKNANNPQDHNFIHWREVFAKQAKILRSMGVEVFNTSPDSALVCFEHKSIDAALVAWGI